MAPTRTMPAFRGVGLRRWLSVSQWKTSQALVLKQPEGSLYQPSHPVVFSDNQKSHRREILPALLPRDAWGAPLSLARSVFGLRVEQGQA